jgi:Lon protease-like protein
MHRIPHFFAILSSCAIAFTTGFVTTLTQQSTQSTVLFGIPIPVFPLRRTVRLPTESLTLNLYEERYLKLAEYVLQQEHPYFGAIYSSNKPQIVRNGTGPIVPLFERGDVGVLFLVLDSEESMIPTRGGIPRRRIRLIARGSIRFQIEEILENGYDSSFILVEGNVFSDQPTADEENCSQDFVDWARTTQAALNMDPILEHSLTLELASFDKVSQRLPDGRSRERLQAIHCRNTQERLSEPAEKVLFRWWR